MCLRLLGQAASGSFYPVCQSGNPGKKKKEITMKEERFILSSSPHIHSGESIPKVMYSVIIALIPATLAGIYLFGLSALKVIAISVGICMFTEAVSQKMMGRKVAISDGSAALTGLLLALNLPSTSPWWMVTVGAVVAIILGKQIYGGLGYNPFNPALVGRVVLLISFPVQMTTWVNPAPLFSGGMDAVTQATPLGEMKTQLLLAGHAPEISSKNLFDFFIGNMGGSLGEVSAIALLIGAIYLLYKGYITWHTPVSFIGSVMVISGIFWWIDPTKYLSPLFHLLTGGLILGAFFMATDMVTTPITRKGMLIFGLGCGLITIIIRLFGGYPEGVSFSILLMNATTPLIDRYTQPNKFGAKNR
jgi:electron transport complex protein RnfD